MPNSQLIHRIEHIQKILMDEFHAGKSHGNSTKGSERELILREFFAKVFPTSLRFGSGSVIDQKGNHSGQMDIVAEFPFFPSFPTPSSPERLYLSESVSFAIEAKSNISAQWDQIQSKAKAFKPLIRKWEGHIHFDKGSMTLKDPTMSSIPFIVVGFKGYQTTKALEKKLLSTPENERPDAVLVIESGAYVGLHSNRKGIGPDGILAFCMDVTNFSSKILMASPDLDGYFSS